LVRTGTAFGSTDGGTGRLVSTLVFGGDPSLSQESREKTVELADELSLLVGTGTAFGSTDGGTGRLVSTLVFGGDPSLSQESREKTVELADELSLLVGDRHRVKLGLLANHAGFRQVNASNRLGTFTFNSLQDFQEMRPASF